MKCDMTRATDQIFFVNCRMGEKLGVGSIISANSPHCCCREAIGTRWENRMLSEVDDDENSQIRGSVAKTKTNKFLFKRFLPQQFPPLF